jgi:ATP-dependent helicase YprA (DUF1998 family)
VNELAAPLAASPSSATSLKKKADVVALLSRLKHRYADRIAGELVVPASDGCYANFPSDLDPRLAQALRSRGIGRFYSHQREAWEAITARGRYRDHPERGAARRETPAAVEIRRSSTLI